MSQRDRLGSANQAPRNRTSGTRGTTDVPTVGQRGGQGPGSGGIASRSRVWVCSATPTYKQTLVFARHTRMRCAYVLCRKGSLSWTRVQQIVEVTQNCLYRFKYGYFFYKNTSIRYRRPLFTPRTRVMRTLYLTTFALLNTTTRPCHYRAWKSQDNFEYNSDWIHLKEESHILLGCLEGE